MRANLTNHDYEMLSAYMDGQLSPGEQRRLEERLRARPEMQTALEDLRRTRALLREAPRRRAPRNFTLTPAMVGEQRKSRPAPFLNLFPALGFTSALAALALVVLVVMQLAPGTSMPQTIAMQPPATAAEQAPLEETARQGVPGAEDSAAAGETAMKAMDTQPAGEAGGETPAAVLEAPAAEPASPEAAAQETPEVGIMTEPESPASGDAAPAAEATTPPVVIWNDPAAAPKGMGGMGGMGGGADGGNLGPLMGPPPAPESNNAMLGMGGAAGSLMLPPEAANSGAAGTSEIIATPEGGEPEPTADPAAQEPSNTAGAGPILGVPEAGSEGEIVDRKAIMGETGEEGEQQSATEAPADPAAEEPQEPVIVTTPTPAPTEQVLAPTEQGSAPVEPATRGMPTATAAAEGERVEDAAQPTAEVSERSMAGAEPDRNAGDPQQAPQPGAVEPAAQPARPLGLDPNTLLTLEIVLGVLAVIAGAGAVIARRAR